MKKYMQLTARRGPVECARAVTLVARELLKDFPDAELVENEPHNSEPDCYMSMLFLAEVSPTKEQEWNGTVLWCATSHHYRPGHPRKNWFVGVEFIEPIILPNVSDKDIVYETMRSGVLADKTSIKWKRQSVPFTSLPEFLLNAARNAHSHKTKKWREICFF